MGSSGPNSINPETGKPYGMRFPFITIGDMVRTQKRLIEHLGIDALLAVCGGSMGGMQALEWAVTFPQCVRAAVVLASTARLSAQAIAFNAVGRNAIMSDPHWRQGDYYDGEPPARGLAIARMVGHITYLSETAMRNKFGRRLQQRANFAFDLDDQFEVESYLEHQGSKFVDRFDANSYIYLSRANDYYDLGGQHGGLDHALRRCSCRMLVVTYSSDWLFPPDQGKEIVHTMMSVGGDATYAELDSPYGHDSFLLETERQGQIISSFLHTTWQRG